MSQASIGYLKEIGFDYKPADSPVLWTHLENQVIESHSVGAKFTAIPGLAFEAMVAAGEEAFLTALVDQHKRTGRLDSVHPVIDLPFIVGTVGLIPLEGADPKKLLKLIENPGSTKERIIHILVVESDAIPCTRQVTVSGGTYSDGHTAGLFGLSPGNGASDKRFGGKCAYLATAQEIKGLADEMVLKAEDIVSVTQKECEAMLASVKALLD